MAEHPLLEEIDRRVQSAPHNIGHAIGEIVLALYLENAFDLNDFNDALSAKYVKVHLVEIWGAIYAESQDIQKARLLNKFARQRVKELSA